MSEQQAHRVVIVGGGFGGVHAAKALGRPPVDLTVIDKRNFHLFQPLLYQVATGTLSPADIATPLRSLLGANKNTKVLLGQAVDIDPERQTVTLEDGEVPYDTLIVATGVSHHYFGNDHWSGDAPGLKTVEDALEIRRRIFSAFEAAEKESDPVQRQAWLTFVVVGGGPTGVELAGAIADLAFRTLKEDFRSIDTREVKILLLEGLNRVLPPFAPQLSANAEAELTRLGVIVKTSTLVTNIENNVVTTKQGDEIQHTPARTILWAAGVKASGVGKILAERTGAKLDRVGRVEVEPDLSIAGHPNIFVVGDLANFSHQGDKPLPGVAPVAIQEGEYVAKLVKNRLAGRPTTPFEYQDKGSMAVIGHNAAVVDLGGLKLTGFFAWLTWMVAHVFFLMGFKNKVVVAVQWVWSYVTRNRSARLITHPVPVAPKAAPEKVYSPPAEAKTPVNV
jgi:NADH dehydrogenase